MSDEVKVTLVRRVTQRVTETAWAAEHPAATSATVKDTVTLWATVSGAAPVRKTRSINFSPARVIVKYDRIDDAPFQADLLHSSVSGPRILKNGLGVELTQLFWFKDDLPDWLMVFAAINLPS
jgi:hypothetical protein